MKRERYEFKMELDQSIDYQTVLDQVASYASFSCSKEKIKNAMPLDSRFEIQEELDLVKEGMSFEQSGALLNMRGCTDISNSVKKASKRMTLSGQELIEVAHFMEACIQVYKTFQDSEFENLKSLSQSMDISYQIVKVIQNQIDSTGQVKEDATSFLKQKHKECIETRLLLQDKARSFIKKNNGSLMESMTTTIQNRICVLVKVQDKNKFGGMVHGQSQSGHAFYVEPNSFVSYNNKIQEVESQIQEEKMRICRELTKEVAKKEISLLSNLETMTWIDSIFAKSKWAVQKDGCVPFIHTKDHHFRFENARHPLIDIKKVVPNTYACRSNEYCLMISGPNMGGKTVTLKTIGLFVTLAHAGFPVICHEAHIPYYQSLWFDIGDQQSIANNLSTFSSHVSKISKICSHCDENSFILLDELGNGTDPLEGASLAVAVLEYLIQKKCTIITSTHYNQVKTFGKTNPNILVSSVEFDMDTLKPTYKYLPGISGSSYAFDISRQYHLENSILQRAEELKEENSQSVDKELERLENLQTEVLQEKEKFRHLIDEAHKIQREAYEEKEKINRKKIEFDRDYEEKLNAMLEEKKQEAQDIIRDLKQLKTDKIHKQTEKLHQLNSMQVMGENQNEAQKIVVGDYVQIEGVNTHGEVLEIRRKEATILTNGMKMKVKLNQLKKIRRPNVKKENKKSYVGVGFKRFPLELNLIGMHVDEAIEALDKYLDDAVVHRATQVRIIHGMGTGALRNAVWKDLDKQPNVKSKMSGGPGDGGLGATIVLLK